MTQCFNSLNCFYNLHFSGLTLYEYHVVLMLYGRNRWERKELDDNGFKAEMNIVKKTLQDSVEILSLEPVTSPEGMLAQQAAISLQELAHSIDSI